MSGIHIAIPWPRGPPYEGGPWITEISRIRMEISRIRRTVQMEISRILGARCARMLWAGALGAAAGLAAPGPPWPPSRPTPPCCAAGACVVCGLASGAFGLVPRPFSAALRGPASPCALGFGPLRGAWPPVARLRPPPGAPAGALGLGALRPPSACGVIGLRSGARPAGRCGLRLLALGPLRVGPLPVCAAPGSPWPSPCGPGLAPRPGSSRPGAVRPGGRFCPPPPGVGVGVPPPAGGGATCG